MPEAVNYTLSFEKPFTHYCEVEIYVNDPGKDSLLFTMPVWAPGSYLVREFAKNVEDVKAVNAGGDKLELEKVSKNSWRVVTKGQSGIKFSYKVYCNELTVRTSEINSAHAFISSSGIFMFVNGFENKKCIVKINLPPEWKNISTGLNRESEGIYSADNYDIFIDSPIEIGNQEVLEFEIKGVKHYICMSGKGNYDREKIVYDFKKIAEEEISLFGGDIPYKHYTFIIHVVQSGGGGLEHLNSFVAQVSRYSFNDKKSYNKFLGLVSHEFFHLWNVKRIRPVELGPFDYNNENHTRSLWVVEGWTSYYDNIFLRRSGILNNEEYFEFVDVEVNDVMRYKGQYRQSLAESSFDAWIRYYRRNENSNNSEISYYTKGALVAIMLNIEIIKSTDAKRSLDDALRMLYEDYKKDTSKGYTPERVKEICEEVSGKNLDGFWQKYINGTDELPFGTYLEDCGLQLVDENETAQSTFDIEATGVNGKYIVTKVFDGGSGYEAGLNSRDEIIAIDGMRADENVALALLKDKAFGDDVQLLISREGIISEITLKLLKPLPKFKIKEIEEKSEQQQKFLNKWLENS
ncbi:MAG: peptidase M61 [bacterium]|nr:peptidase M61 [bacterium]